MFIRSKGCLRTNLTRFLVAALMLVCGSSAFGHQTKLSSSRLVLDGATVVGELELNALDIQVAIDRVILREDEAIDEGLVKDAMGEIERYIGSKNRVSCGADDAQFDIDPSPRIDGDHLIFSVSWRCAIDQIPSRYDVQLFQELDPQSRHMVSFTGDQSFVGLLDSVTQSIQLADERYSIWDLVVKFVVSGIEHIAIGFDHIAFLLAVIVLGRSFWPLFKVVTAFTIAHSITLTLSVLDIVSMPGNIVEPIIALSIVYVAIENFFVKDIARRYWVTFLFGLIHGFGFASVLRDYGLPEAGLVWALGSFNLGVEIGQLIIVFVCVVMWKLLLHTRYFGDANSGFERQRTLSLTISAAVLLLGAGWFIERVFL
ncbi:MAG: HupE/UreJ family protein [Betaproteobacteria bacterium]